MLPGKQKSKIQVWLYEQTDTRIEGVIIGMDEYMNLVIDEAEELSMKKDTRKALGTFRKVEDSLHALLMLLIPNVLSHVILGRILLKGDNVTLLMEAPQK